MQIPRLGIEKQETEVIGVASIWKRKKDRSDRNASWLVSYVDESGKRRTISGCADKQATEALARKIEADVMLKKRGVINGKADRYGQADRKPLLQHLGEYEMAQQAKGITGQQVKEVGQRVRRVLSSTFAIML